MRAFAEGWNNHGIHTAHTMTLNQLCTTGMLALCQPNRVGLDFYESIDENYGTDEEELGQPDDKGILIPRSTICLSEQQMPSYFSKLILL